jgi:hypothetical protein
VHNIAGVIKQVAAKSSCAARVALRHGHEILGSTWHGEIMGLPKGGKLVIEMRDEQCGIGASELANNDFVPILHGIAGIHRGTLTSRPRSNSEYHSALLPNVGGCKCFSDQEAQRRQHFAPKARRTRTQKPIDQAAI